jgi:hypothetical protein
MGWWMQNVVGQPSSAHASNKEAPSSPPPSGSSMHICEDVTAVCLVCVRVCVTGYRLWLFLRDVCFGVSMLMACYRHHVKGIEAERHGIICSVLWAPAAALHLCVCVCVE